VVLATDRQTTPMAATTPMPALVDVGTALRAPEPLTPMTLAGMAAKELLAEAYYDGGNCPRSANQRFRTPRQP
jgi:hypothetical protein